MIFSSLVLFFGSGGSIHSCCWLWSSSVIEGRKRPSCRAAAALLTIPLQHGVRTSNIKCVVVEQEALNERKGERKKKRNR